MNTPASEQSSAADPTSSASPDATSLIGKVISDRYKIRELIGEGGMGAVYLAEHTHMRKRVALKLLHAETSQDKEILARFRREAEAAARVEHPNVAAATDFGQTEDGSFFLVLEYVEGVGLRSLIDKGPLEPRRSLHIARQMASALERAHGGGVVHRDLKPENVMLVSKADDPDFVKVLDFGVAKLEPLLGAGRDTSQPLTRLGTILGTPEYMAPEQALGETVGPQADLYAVGIMLYEMLTGKHPFQADDRMAVLSMHIVAPVPTMEDRNPAIDIPPPIEELTRSLLEKDMKLRPQGARALVDAIDTAAAQSGIELPQGISARSFGRESNPGPPPDISRSPSPNAAAVVAAPVSSADPLWKPNDALAKTDYGSPSSFRHPSSADASTGLPFGVPAFLQPIATRLEKVPRMAIIGVASAIPFFVLILLVATILSHRSSTDASDDAMPGASATKGGAQAPKPTRASPERIQAAQAQGPSALEALATEFPDDLTVKKKLFESLIDAGRNLEALRALRVLLKADKEAATDTIVQFVVNATQKAETAEEAWALLEGPLGAKGVDAMIEMQSSKVSLPTRNRINKSLASPNVRANATPAAGVLIDLKSASDCATRKEVLERVKDDGDARILPAIKQMKSPRGCGFAHMRDCHPCLRKDDTLDDAIKAVEARAAAAK